VGTLTNTVTVTTATTEATTTNNTATTMTTVTASAPPPPTNCDPSYPTVCIPPPPDLDCGQIAHRNFQVIYTVPNPDPHNFDGDRDGIGCET
jgi:hypothetical protein